MTIFNATYVALLAVIGVVIIYLVPPRKYDPKTGEIIRENKYTFWDIVGFIVFLILAFISLYSINCLNSEHHYSTASNTGVFGFGSSSVAQPDKNCIYLSWFHAFFLLVLSIITISIGYNAKYTNPDRKTTLFDELQK